MLNYQRVTAKLTAKVDGWSQKITSPVLSHQRLPMFPRRASVPWRCWWLAWCHASKPGLAFWHGTELEILRSKGGKSMTRDNTKQLHIASYVIWLPSGTGQHSRHLCKFSVPAMKPNTLGSLKSVFTLQMIPSICSYIHYIQYIYIYIILYIYTYYIYIYYCIYIYIIYPVISKNHLQVLGQRLRQPLHLERWKWRDGRAGALAPYDERKLGEGVAKTVV